MPHAATVEDDERATDWCDLVAGRAIRWLEPQRTAIALHAPVGIVDVEDEGEGALFELARTGASGPSEHRSILR